MAVAGACKADGNPVAARAAGAADAVHVVFGLHRQVVVDDVRDALHVDAARGDVGGHEHFQPAAAQRLQRAVARALVHVAVHGRGRVTLAVQVLRELVGVALGRGEDDGLQHVRLSEDGLQQAVLVAHVIRKMQALLDVDVARLRGVDGDAQRVVQERAREANDARFDRGREEHGLARLRDLGEDGLEVVLEAHVEHAVGFVQHQELQAAEIDAAGVHLVEHAARRGHEDVDAVLQHAVLQRVGHAADDREGLHAHVAAVGVSGFRHLHREFARGREHQDARAAAGGLVLHHELLQRGQHEGGGLAAAGLRRDQEVAPLDGFGDRAGLHGGRFGVAGGLDRFKDGRGQAEGFKSNRQYDFADGSHGFSWCQLKTPAPTESQSYG